MQTENQSAGSAVLVQEIAPSALLPAWTFRLKRCLDCVAAMFLLMVIFPLFVVIAVMIRLDSRGSAIYTRIRMGKHGRHFTMYKFRSMYVDADERLHHFLETDPELKHQYERYHKLRDDPRITRVGKFLRRFSLDELPQLWNVLRGDMGFIGPRPYDPGERAKMEEHDRIILAVKPGLTGLWQVSGRSHLSFYERLDVDVQYVSNWSLSLDLRILALTLGSVLSGRGAY